jgi:4a-hydroxytetrahydrobiopterin dehydratase
MGDQGRLSRQQISDAVDGTGWRYVLGQLCAAVPVGSLTEAVDVAARLVTAAGAERLWLDVRPDRLLLAVQSPDTGSVTAADLDLAHRLAAAVADLGLPLAPEVDTRSVQVLEIGIDALDIAAVRPFWKAVLGYADEPGGGGPEDALVDAGRQGPAIWFQQMDAPRPQRNRLHFDISVPHDEAPHRIRAAIGAGGTLVSDAHAPAFWVLADAEGNEACITTWQGRDG